MDGGSALPDLALPCDARTVQVTIAIIGGGESPGVWPMHYFDERGVMRAYQVRFDGGIWKMWRDQPGFSHRLTGIFEDDGRTIRVSTELQQNGPWKPDLQMVYRRT
jgi:hypothetical protein